MKRFLIFAGIIGSAIGIWVWVYFFQQGLFFFPQESFNKNLELNSEIRAKLAYFLMTRLNLLEGKFEIIDIVGLNVKGLVGEDYFLVTLRGPDGRLYQLTIQRGSQTAFEWQINEASLQQINLTEYNENITDEHFFSFTDMLKENEKEKRWFSLIDAFAQKQLKKEADFLFLQQPVELTTESSVEINNKKNIGFTPTIVNNVGPDSIWVIDYPKGIIGPGYRSYLYQKIKGQR
ncbi:MAG: hypothetical protein N2606_04515 [Candidatus Omnitrophica bacterium]|nr:hypothetical protein [Candidatus Omnitrophota bacterium]